jgi:hypothetical protein
MVTYEALGFTVDVGPDGIVRRAPPKDAWMVGLPVAELRERCEAGEGGAPGGVYVQLMLRPGQGLDFSRWEGPGGTNPIGVLVGPARRLVDAYDVWAQLEDDLDPDHGTDLGLGGPVDEFTARRVLQHYLTRMQEAVTELRAGLADLDRLSADRPERLVRWPTKFGELPPEPDPTADPPPRA